MQKKKRKVAAYKNVKQNILTQTQAQCKSNIWALHFKLKKNILWRVVLQGWERTYWDHICICRLLVTWHKAGGSFKKNPPLICTLVDSESSVKYNCMLHKTPKECQPLNQIYTFLISEIFTWWNLYTIPFVKNSVFKCPLQIQRTSNARS